jgi:beta-glucosidase
VEFDLDRTDLSYWSPDKKTWVAEPGTFEIQIGSSSRDIRLHAPLKLQEEK